MGIIWILLIVMQFKHFIADYLLQGKYMLGKFRDKGWMLPLAAHCAVHFVFTFIIAASVLGWSNPKVGIFCLVVASMDFIIHFIMDRIKASPKMLGRYNALSKNEMINHIMPVIQQAEKQMEKDPGLRIGSPLHNQYLDAKDRVKSNVMFWWMLGVDQMVHHLTDILIVALIMSAI